MAAYSFLLAAILSVTLIANICADKQADLVLQYKSNVTLKCDLPGDVEFFYQVGTDNQTKLSPGNKVSLDNKALTITDLRSENIKVNYTCKSTDGEELKFNIKIQPYIYKPDKASQTATEGGKVEFKCALLYGTEEGTDKISWTWKKGEVDLAQEEGRIRIDSSAGNETILELSKVSEADKGDYSCHAKNNYGEHAETIKLRVKDAYAALWPFLAILAEVVILCAIILIYEKKCSKKPSSNEDDNEQAQNLMGNKDGQISDVKKRNAKA